MPHSRTLQFTTGSVDQQNPDEINLDEDDESSDEEGDGGAAPMEQDNVTELPVPSAVFGGLANAN